MRNNTFILFFIACVWALQADAATPSFLRSRKLRSCDDYDLSKCHQHEDKCKVIRRGGQKNLCVGSNRYEKCLDFDEEAECWDNSNLACIWKGNKCEDRLGVRVVDRLCHKNQDCDSKEICASLHSSSDPCLDDSLGQCIPKPNDCPSTNEKVCGCDGRTYWNQCECLEAKENVKYSGSCSDSRDRAFRRYVRDIDDGDFTDDLLVQFIFSSVSTDGDTCLTELECKKQIRDINHLNNFRVVSDPNNCGCYELNGSGYWSDSNQCSAQEKKVDLDGNRKRIHCDLNRIYRDVRNVPLDTCLTMSGCNDQCEHDYRRGADIETNPYSSKCGCYMNMQKNQCHWNSCGDNIKKASDHLPGDNTRVWCVDRARDVRDIVYDTCLTRDECEEQGEFNGNVKTPANVKDFDSESICGCYSKGGDLYWARCDIHGNFYGELNNQKERIHCQDVGSRSYRIFDEGHTHFHVHPHDIEDHGPI